MSKRLRLDPEAEAPSTEVPSTGYLAWCKQHSPQWLKMATVQLRCKDRLVLPAHRDILGAVSEVAAELAAAAAEPQASPDPNLAALSVITQQCSSEALGVVLGEVYVHSGIIPKPPPEEHGLAALRALGAEARQEAVWLADALNMPSILAGWDTAVAAELASAGSGGSANGDSSSTCDDSQLCSWLQLADAFDSQLPQALEAGVAVACQRVKAGNEDLTLQLMATLSAATCGALLGALRSSYQAQLESARAATAAEAGRAAAAESRALAAARLNQETEQRLGEAREAAARWRRRWEEAWSEARDWEECAAQQALARNAEQRAAALQAELLQCKEQLAAAEARAEPQDDVIAALRRDLQEAQVELMEVEDKAVQAEDQLAALREVTEEWEDPQQLAEAVQQLEAEQEEDRSYLEGQLQAALEEISLLRGFKVLEGCEVQQSSSMDQDGGGVVGGEAMQLSEHWPVLEDVQAGAHGPGWDG